MSNTNEIEQSYLSCLLEAAKSGKVETRLEKDDFENAKHGRIFETILKQWHSKTEPNIVTLAEELSDIPPWEIGQITSIEPSEARITFFENQIFEASKTRNFIKSLQRAKDEIDKGINTDAIIKNLLPALVEVTTARNEAGIKTAAELLKTQFPEIRWIVPGLIGEGLTLINGAPKIGKSWLVLNLAIAAAAEGKFLGTLTAEQTDTLYLALEDTDRRLNSRLKILKAPDTDKLKIATQWRDSYTGLENYLKVNKEIGLVIIDTLARFADIEDMNDYAVTTGAMARLKRIADNLNIAIVLIHHSKKTGRGGTSGSDWMEAALGSTGLTGATDSTIFISRDRREETKTSAVLYATGRDTADRKEFLKLDVDSGGWTITGQPPKLDKPPKNTTQTELGSDEENYQMIGGIKVREAKGK